MKQSVSRIFLSALLLLTPAASVLASSCDSSCSSNSCSTSCNDSCSNSCSSDCSSSSCTISCADSCNDDCNSCSSCYCPTVYIPRSQGSNTVLLFGHPYAHRYDVGCFYGGWYMDFEYQRSFNSCQLANCLFGTNTLKFQGSQVAGRDSSALIAENFGLSQTFNGSLTIKPVIQNYDLHWSWFFGFDEWAEGLYLKLDLTFAHQNRQLISDCSCDTNVTATGADFPAGYMDVASVAPITDLKTALAGQTSFGDMVSPWKFGKFNFCSSQKSGIAAFDFNLGYDFLRCEDYFLGVFFRWTAPTGNRPDATEVFSAVVGDGHHWEIGGGISGAWKFWECSDEQSMSFLLDGYVVTLLKDCQMRTFDLKQTGTQLACMSRYMLLKQIDASGNYTGNLINAVNYATRNAEVKVNVKGDMTIRFEYVNGNFDLGFGYNLFGKSREEICNISAPLCGLDANTYAIKGCQGTNDFYYTFVSGSATNPAVLAASPYLNASERNANAYSCGTVDNATATPISAPTTSAAGYLNANWDSNGDAGSALAGNTYAAITGGTSPAGDFVQTYTSNLPTTLDNSCATDLDICSGEAPRQLTNKGFVMMHYRWNDCDWAPFLGVGAEVEGGSRNCDLAQWGVFIRGGISY